MPNLKFTITVLLVSSLFVACSKSGSGPSDFVSSIRPIPPSVNNFTQPCTGPYLEGVPSLERDSSRPECPSCIGALMPSFTLLDVQPRSCAFGGSYGLDLFGERVTIVALLSAGCSYCRSQAGKLEELRLDFAVEGQELAMVAINDASQAHLADLLTTRCSFAVLQDTEEAGVWELFGGRKDDIFLYDAVGRLRAFFRSGEGPEANLSTEEGYTNLVGAIRSAIID